MAYAKVLWSGQLALLLLLTPHGLNIEASGIEQGDQSASHSLPPTVRACLKHTLTRASESKRVYVIDGRKFTSYREFRDEVGRVLIPGAQWGRSLNAFNRSEERRVGKECA